jgi:hypothetical protein
MDPDELRDEAERLREHAEEIADDNPTASDYHSLRADWCDYLARKREEEQTEGEPSA